MSPMNHGVDMSADTWILTAQCPSRLGTVDVVTRFLKENRCYITEQQSFDDRHAERFLHARRTVIFER